MLVKEREREWLSMRQIAQLYGVSRSTLYRMRSEGLLHPYTVANSTLVRYRRADIEKLFNPKETEK